MVTTLNITISLNSSSLSSPPISPDPPSLDANATDQASHNALAALPSGSTDNDTSEQRNDPNTIDIAAKLRYLERFQNQTKQTKSITDKLVEFETTLVKVKATLARLEAAKAKRSQMSSSVQLYKIIGQGIDSFRLNARLLCWAFGEGLCNIRNCVAPPKPTIAEAKGGFGQISLRIGTLALSQSVWWIGILDCSGRVWYSRLLS
jgi:hypothetical protein